MVLRNFVTLLDDTPARMHFASGELIEKDIADSLTRQPKKVRALEFLVDELDGARTSATFSVLAEKLAVQLMPWVTNGRLVDVDFVITKRGSGFGTNYSVQVVQRGGR